jgi:LacI family transcriptional regulator
VIPTLDLAIFARSTHAMQSTLAQAGYQLLVASHNYDLAAETQLVAAFQHRGVDALVLVGAQHQPALWKSLKTWNKPSLLTWVCDERLPSVGFDNQAIAQMATRHLLELGHRHISMISGFTQQNDRAAQREKGFINEMHRAGQTRSAQSVSQQELTIKGGRHGFQALLTRNPETTALVCGNDMLAIGAMLQAQECGQRVPEDISIVGIDNHELAGEIPPGLSTVSVPVQELGQITAAQILQILAGQPIANQRLLPFQFVKRNSTAAPRTVRAKSST